MRQALRAAALLAAPALMSVAMVSSAAAQATNFRQEWQDIKDSIPGLGTERDPIDFSERAPLVVPPSNELPPPVAAAPRLAITDPDMVERRKALSDPRRPVPVTDPGASASGLSARAYLIQPPSGMQDPAAVASQAKADGFKDAPARHKKHVAHKRTPAPAVAAAQ